MGREPVAPPREDAGFTLLELLVVLAIVAIAMRFVVPSWGRDVPEARVQSEARQLAAELSYLRSEAKLQGQRFGLEFEAPGEGQGPHRYRIVMPREQRVVSENSELYGQDIPPELRLHWTYLDDAVKFVGVRVGHADQDGVKARQIFFDPLGRTSQKVLYIGHRVETELVYSIVVPPLAGTIDVVKGRVNFPTATDSDF